MTLTNLKEELRRKTALEAGRIAAEADAEAARIRSEAQAQAARIVADAPAEALEIAAKERTQVSAAKLKARRRVQDARFELVEEVASQLKVLLARRPQSRREYQKLLESLIRAGMKEAGKDCTLRVRREDAAFAKKFGDVGPALDTVGGVLVVSSDGRVKYNNTFEALLEARDEPVKQKAFELLFK